MAKGWDTVQQATEARQEQQQQFESQRKPTLKINQNNPGPIQIRFLEQGADVNNFKVHEYKVPDGRGGFYNKRFTCLAEVNAECPGCRAGMKQKVRGVYNIIQRNRPILRRGTDGKALKNPDGSWIIDGYADEVVIADVGGPTAEMLRQLDGTSHGLMSRDFVVTFSGNQFQAWNVTAAMDAQGNSLATAMSEADMALAVSKHNIDEYMQPPSPQEAARIVAQYGGNSGASANAGAPTPAQGNGMAAPQSNGFLTGAQLPAGGAFAGAQQAAPPPVGAPPAPVQPPAPLVAPAVAAPPPAPAVAPPPPVATPAPVEPPAPVTQ